MTPLAWTYLCYLLISIALTIWVARTLHYGGRIFLVETFHGNEALADSVNHLLVVGFYLVNLGFVTLALKSADKPADLQDVLETLSSKIGLVLLVLGGMHFFNLYVFSRMRKRVAAQYASARPAPGPRGGRSGMKRLYVLFDAECAICNACRLWLLRQPAYLELRFIPLQSSEIAQRFPGLLEQPDLDLREKLVVIGDDGLLYQGQHAWIMCLYALRDYREWAQRLAHPVLLPLARRVCEAVSRHRLALSQCIESPAALALHLAQLPPEICPLKGGC